MFVASASLTRRLWMATHGTTGYDPSEDERQLHKLGYAQVLFREMGGFSNFAISFTIISILAGCLTSYYIAFQWGGPIAVTWGWLIVGGFCIIVSLALAETAAIGYGLAIFATSLLNLLWDYPNNRHYIFLTYTVVMAIALVLNFFAVSI